MSLLGLVAGRDKRRLEGPKTLIQRNNIHQNSKKYTFKNNRITKW